MYFALNPPPAEFPSLIFRHLEDLRAAEPGLVLNMYALVDCAFDETLSTERYSSRPPRMSLYAGTSLAGLGAAAPHLFSGPEEMSQQSAWLEKLYVRCGGKPMVSVIASALDLSALAEHLRPYLIAETEDTLQWPVRLGDTRVLPHLLDALTEAQSEHLLGPMHCWWMAGRDGSLIVRHGRAMPTAPPAGFDKLPLGDAVFSRLVEAAEADAVLAQIEDQQPDVLRDLNPAECHARVQHFLEVATSAKIEAAGARAHFSLLALILADEFAEHPELVGLLQNTRQGADYAVEVGALSNDFWNVNSR